MSSSIQGIDSLVTFNNSQGRNGRGTLIHISRTTIVFEIYNPYSIVQLSEVLPNLVVVRGERTIYKGRAVVSHILSTGLMTIVSTTLVDAWTDLAGLLPGGDLRLETERFVDDWTRGHQLNPKYQLIVGAVRNFLGELNRWLEAAEIGISSDYNSVNNKEILEEFYQETQNPVLPKISELFAEFELEAGKIEPDHVTAHKAYTQRELHPLMLCAPYVDRSFNKPLGYAGDYELINMNLRQANIQEMNTYARIVHDFCVEATAAEAHRNRIIMLKRRLIAEAERVAIEEERLFNVINIACGPSVEIQQFITESSLSNHCSFQLVDFESEALEHSQRKIEEAIASSGNRPVVKFIKKSIDDLLREIHQEGNLYPASFDMVYCAGLFDYFSDQICKRLVAQFYSWLRPGGLVSVTNVHARNPNRQLMEHLLEWHLVYRNDQGMKYLAPENTNYDIDLDETKVNVFLDIRKPAYE